MIQKLLLKLIWVFFGLFFLTPSSAQGPEVFLYSEGSEDVFKLVWVPHIWPEDLKGFVVKRKAVDDTRWITLSKNVITPSTDGSKRLEYVTNSFSYQELLKKMYNSFVMTSTLEALGPKEMYRRYLSNPQGLSFIELMISMDFEFALLYGFGYIDFFVPNAESYVYGIFPVYHSSGLSDGPLHEVEWGYGGAPAIRVSSEKSVEVFYGEGLKPNWKFSVAELQRQHIVGFHVNLKDEDGQQLRLTDRPLMVNMSAKITDLYFMDKKRDPSQNWKYQAVPVNIFKTEGEPIEIEWKPERFSGR